MSLLLLFSAILAPFYLSASSRCVYTLFGAKLKIILLAVSWLITAPLWCCEAELDVSMSSNDPNPYASTNIDNGPYERWSVRDLLVAVRRISKEMHQEILKVNGVESDLRYQGQSLNIPSRDSELRSTAYYIYLNTIILDQMPQEVRDQPNIMQGAQEINQIINALKTREFASTHYETINTTLKRGMLVLVAIPLLFGFGELDFSFLSDRDLIPSALESLLQIPYLKTTLATCVGFASCHFFPFYWNSQPVRNTEAMERFTRAHLSSDLTVFVRNVKDFEALKPLLRMEGFGETIIVEVID